MPDDSVLLREAPDPAILRAMQAVPRDKFIPPAYRRRAWADEPVSIGWGQTTSQPQLIAKMIELLALRPGDKVLEIGAGSGYQTAILLELGTVEVYSLEVIPELAEQAAARLAELGYTRVHLKQGDGYLGWPEYAPFEAIIVSAAPSHLPPPLAEQLAPGGRIVIPIGSPWDTQTLWKFVKDEDGLKSYALGLVAFVPLTRPTQVATPKPTHPAHA